MSIEFSLSGFEDVERLLNTFPEKVEKRLIKGALRKGALVLKKIAKSNAPVGTGKLRRSLAHRTGRGPIAQVYVKGGKDGGWYANFVERGTEKHSLRKGAKLARGTKQDQTIIHPGTRANPFLSKSLDQGYEQTLNAIAEELSRLIEKEVYK